jgi:hypothetical protein
MAAPSFLVTPIAPASRQLRSRSIARKSPERTEKREQRLGVDRETDRENEVRVDREGKRTEQETRRTASGHDIERFKRERSDKH